MKGIILTSSAAAASAAAVVFGGGLEAHAEDDLGAPVVVPQELPVDGAPADSAPVVGDTANEGEVPTEGAPAEDVGAVAVDSQVTVDQATVQEVTATAGASIEVTTYAPPPIVDVTSGLEVIHTGIRIDSIIGFQPDATQVPEPQTFEATVNGVVDALVDGVADLIVPDQPEQQVTTLPPPSETASSQSSITQTSSTANSPAIIVVGAGVSVEVAPDGTISATSGTGGTSVATAETVGSTGELATSSLTATQSSPEFTTSAEPKIENGKPVLSSLVSRTENIVDLSLLEQVIETVNEGPVDPSDFPSPKGYKKLPDGDTFADFNYVINNGEEGGYPTCVSEQFASSKTLASALLVTQLQQNFAQEFGLSDFVPTLKDFTSTHAREHYNGGDFDLHAIYVNGKYDHEANLGFLRAVVLLRNPDGTPLFHHIVTSDKKLADILNEYIDSVYGEGARPNIVYDAENGHIDHQHFSRDGGEEGSKELPRATPDNTAACDANFETTGQDMSYAEAVQLVGGTVAPANNNTVPGDDGLVGAQSATSELDAILATLGAPQPGDPLNLLATHLSELTYQLDQQSAQANTTPQPGTGVEVIPQPNSADMLAITPLLSDSFKNYQPRTAASALELSSQSTSNGGTLNYEEAYGPQIESSDVYLLFRAKGLSKEAAAVATVIVGRESGFRPGVVGDLLDAVPSYGLGQMKDFNSQGEYIPYRDPQSNLAPQSAIENFVTLLNESGFTVPWESYQPDVITPESLFEATRLAAREMTPSKRAAFEARVRGIANDVYKMIQVYEPLFVEATGGGSM